eukprot:m.160513 g.160513  ORF g.160513 m.160513 type:complete len:70 (-) comp13384_c9_seq3:1371-1580(-)
MKNNLITSTTTLFTNMNDCYNSSSPMEWRVNPKAGLDDTTPELFLDCVLFTECFLVASRVLLSTCLDER